MSGKPHSNALIHHTIYKVEQYWDGVRKTLHPSAAETSYREKWFSQIPYFKQLSFHNSICIVLWDIVSNRFLIAIDERKITQYDMSLYTEADGVNFSLGNFHPEHLHAIQLMNQCGLKTMADYRHVQHDKIICNFDALYRVGSGNHIHILQQIVPVETDSNGQPFLFLSYVRDISHLKKQPSASFVFTTPEESKFWKYNFGQKELGPVAPFTAQEKKVLAFLSEGKHASYIADHLSISLHTVHTHCRHMLAKTSCIDSTALIAYCQATGLL